MHLLFRYFLIHNLISKRQWFLRFFPFDQVPIQICENCGSLTAGRPENKLQRYTFCETIFESNDEEQLTISNFVDKMEEVLHDIDENEYDSRYTKTKLIQHYCTELIISEEPGQPDNVTRRWSANDILHDFYKKPKKKWLGSRKTETWSCCSITKKVRLKVLFPRRRILTIAFWTSHSWIYVINTNVISIILLKIIHR